MSSTITVTHNPESEKRPRRSPVQRPPVERSLRDRVGWDPFQGTKSSSFGDVSVYLFKTSIAQLFTDSRSLLSNTFSSVLSDIVQ